MVNSLSETQLALINIHAGNLIRSSRLVLFSEPFFLPLDMAVVVQAGNLCSQQGACPGACVPQSSHTNSIRTSKAS